jgi:undecaprenyl-diphosphatase
VSKGAPAGDGARPPALRTGDALVLGLLQGPTELLPVSSSAHTTLLPWLAKRSGATTIDPTVRKSFEVSLHLGTLAALIARPPHRDRRARAAFLAPALALPSLAGYACGGAIERRLGTPPSIAAGLLLGSAALAGGEALAHARSPHAQARHEIGPREAGVREGLALGAAQALALIPGVSRSGAALAAGRALGFSRVEADALSWQAGIGVMAGAALLQGLRLARSRPSPRTGAVLAAGAAVSFLSTRASIALLTPERRARALPACAGYRVALAGLVAFKLRR